MKISKKILNKYFIDFEGRRELNCVEGFRDITISFTNKTDWYENEDDGEKYLIVLERFLNECYDLDCYIEDGSKSVFWDIAEITLCVNEDHIERFNSYYKVFKDRCNELIENYKYEVEKLKI